MATKIWTGGGSASSPQSGVWTTKTNWSPAGIPAAGDDVIIGGSGLFTVSLSANATCNTLTINNSAAALAVGKYTLKVGASGASAINLQAGHITISGGKITDAGGIALASGTSLTGAGTLTVSGGYAGAGTLQASGGTLDIFGTISSGVVLQIASGSASTLKIQGIGTAAAAISITSSNQTLEIGSSGHLTINAAQIVNNGTIRLDGSTLTDTFGIAIGSAALLTGSGQVGSSLSGSGTIMASGGTLDLTGTVTSGLVLQIGSTTHSDLKIDGTATTASAITINGTNQKLEIGSSGNLTIGAAESITNGIIQLDGGILADASGLAIGKGASLVGSGTVAAPLSGTGTVTASGGTLDLTKTVSSGPSLTINSTVASDLKIDGAAVAASAIPITSVNQTLEIGANGNLTINAAESISNGTIKLDGGTLADSSGLTIGSGALLVGRGTVVAPLSGTGTIRASGGTLDLTKTVNSGPKLQIDTTAGSVLKIDGTATGANAITINNANQILEIGAAANLTITAAESISNGTVQLDGGALTDGSGVVVGAGAHLAGFGAVTAGSTATTDVDGTGAVTARGGVLEF